MKPCTRIVPKALIPFVLLAAGTPATQAAKWPVLDPAELAETQAVVDPEAGAEVILRSVEIDHADYFRPSEEHYFRIRIYNERGIKLLSKVEITYRNSTTIAGVAARTIKPDGTVIELPREEIHDQEIVKSGNERTRVKAFAPAGLEPGAILEYRYTRLPAPGRLLTWVAFQGSLPVRRATCKVEVLAISDYTMMALFFNWPDQGTKRDKMGAYLFELTNIPAGKEEPFSPPEVHTSASILFFYKENKDGEQDTYWRRRGRSLHTETTRTVRPAKAVAAAAASIAASGDSAVEKLEKFYDFCRTKITNRNLDTITYTREERKKLPRNRDPSDTLANGSGEAEDINLLFAALAATTGLEARLAVVNDRSVMLVSQSFAERFTITHKVVAVSIDGEWKFFDPGSVYLPFGTLSWEHSDTCYVLADKEGGEIKLLNGPPSSLSTRRRRADLTLDENGTLEGVVRTTYSGLWDAARKNNMDDESPEEREKTVREEVQSYMPRAEVTEIRIDGAADPLTPLWISYRIRVPDYAERTGSRLFFQPAVFEKGAELVFKEPMRESQILFRYRRTEDDTVVIKLPAGYALEEASAPEPLDLGVVGRYDIALGMVGGGQAVALKRKFRLDAIALAPEHYEALRSAFEIIHNRDNHLLTLRRAERGPESGVEPPSTSGEE
ncbi:MAG TPA: DUF3857 domain-containing protein [Opitutaceae bacterium]